MDIKSYLMPLAALVALIVLGYLVYSVGIPNGTGSNETNITPAKDAEALLVSALEKQGRYDNYTYSYSMDTDGYPTTTRLVHAQDSFMVDSGNPFFHKIIYSNSSARALCVSFGSKTSCSLVAENSTLESSFAKSKLLLLGQNTEKDIERLRFLIKKGAISFRKVEAGEVGGKKCDVVRYTLDYSKLNLADLNDIGMSPNDPVLLYSKDYSFEYSIGSESEILSSTLDYSFNGEKKTTKTMLVEARWGSADASELALPEQLANSSTTESLFLDALSAEKSVLACSRNATTKDACIRIYAIENSVPDICLLAGAQKDKCILILAPKKLRDDLCASVDDALLKDDCWIEMAAGKNSTSLCAKVSDLAKKAYCDSILANATTTDSNAGN